MQGSPTASPGTMEQGNGAGQVPVPPSTPSSRGVTGLGGLDGMSQPPMQNVPTQPFVSWPGPYVSSGCQPGPCGNAGLLSGQCGFASCGGQPSFGGCDFGGFPRGSVESFPVSGQQRGVGRQEGFRMPPGNLMPGSSDRILQQISQLVGSLNNEQSRELQQMLVERFQMASRQLPEFFGEVPRVTAEPFVPEPSRDVWATDEAKGKEQLDAFSRSEKWLSPAPIPPVETWKTRELEILGWSDYLTQLVSWSAQGSEQFSNEIAQAAKWPSAIEWSSLTKSQKSRGTRLRAILKAAFVSHPRTSMLIAVFGEGMSLGSDFVFGALPVSQANANGFELLRQLSLEFCLRSRGEALAMRTSLAAKSFTLSSAETTVGSVVSDTIRKLASWTMNVQDTTSCYLLCHPRSTR